MAKTSRKRQRRSGLGILLWCLAALAVLLVVAGFAFSLWLKSYLRSDTLLARLQMKTEEKLSAECEISPLQWAGDSAYADRLHALGGESARFSSLEAEGVRVDIDFGAVRSGEWKIPSATMNRLQLDISPERLGKPHAVATTSAGAGKSGSPGFLASFAPKRFRLDQAQIEEFFFTYQQGKADIAIDGSRVDLTIPDTNDALNLLGSGGTLRVAGLPEMEISNFNLRVREDGVYVNDAALNLFGDAELGGSGEINFRTGGEVDLKLHLAALDLSDVVSKSLKGRVHGVARGEILSRKNGAGAPITHEGEIIIEGGMLEEFAVLEDLAEHTRTDRFRRLSFDSARGNFRRTPERIEIRELELQADSLIRIVGDLDINGRALDGRLRVGVTPDTLRWIPGAEQKVFIEREGGFVWTDLAVGGTLDEPSENLSARLRSAAAQQMVEDAAGQLLRAVGAPIETLKAPTELLEKVVPDALQDATGGLIDGGLKVLDGILGN